MVLGKFYPFHLGHKYLIDKAIENCDEVVVYACSISTETIGPSPRFESIKKTYRKNKSVNIIHITEDLPQEPNEHPDFWNIWKRVVYNNLPESKNKLEVIFGSEDYIIPFSQVLEIEGVILDKERKNVPISGTLVRSNFIKNWKYLPFYTKLGIIKDIYDHWNNRN